MMTAENSGFVLVVSAPSGAGKTTICRMLLDRDDRLRRSISATTRPCRPQETHGTDYSFLTDEAFETGIQNGEFLEWARYEGRLYGTPREAVESSLDRGHVVLMAVDVQGLRQLKPKLDGRVASVLVYPPSLEALRQRLTHRRTEATDELEGRLARAITELDAWTEYDYLVLNDDLESAVQAVAGIICAERHRRHRQQGSLLGVLQGSCSAPHGG